MRVTYHTPEKLLQMMDAESKTFDFHLAKADEALAVRQELYKALEESYRRVQKGLPVGVTVDEPEETK